MEMKSYYEKGTRYWWLNEESNSVLKEGYLLDNETPQDAILRITTKVANTLGKPEWQPIFQEILEKGWLSASSPIWSNCGTQRGLPISCFNVHLSDSIDSISTKLVEVIKQTQNGGGTSGYFGELRYRGAPIKNNGESSGSISHARSFDVVSQVMAQGRSRRGAFAMYQNVRHKDIKEFLTIRDIGSELQAIFFGVCIDDLWMEEMLAGDEEKQDIWAAIIKSRKEKGMPYIFFTDTVNNNKPDIYKELKLQINGSNLCSEIALPSSEHESFVCCLSSMNLELFDEWKDTDVVFYAMAFLDAIISEFVEKTVDMPGMIPAHNFAKRHRAVGLGVLGWHSYLQKNNIAYESMEAKMLNNKIFKHLGEKTKEATIKLGEMLGYAPIYDELSPGSTVTKQRNTTTMTLPPTTSSSAISGQSTPSFEVSAGNAFTVGLAKGNYIRKNKYLKIVLQELGQDTDEVWKSIIMNGGSVRHLDFLSSHQKAVFKIFKETSQKEIIIQASQRQKYIDQSQSLNLNIPNDIEVYEIHELLVEAWKLGIKTLYYQRSNSVAKDLLSEIVSCKSCEG